MLEITRTKHSCSFCGKSARVIQRVDSPGNYVCLDCVKTISAIVGHKNHHEVTCVKCGDSECFYAVYEKEKSKIFFKKQDIDEEGVPVYLLVRTEGTWDVTNVPTKFRCENCNSTLIYKDPFKNPYVRKYLDYGGKRIDEGTPV